MEDPILKLRQSFIISNKPGYLSEKFDELQLPYTQYFSLKFCTRILLTNVFSSQWFFFNFVNMSSLI